MPFFRRGAPAPPASARRHAAPPRRVGWCARVRPSALLTVVCVAALLAATLATRSARLWWWTPRQGSSSAPSQRELTLLAEVEALRSELLRMHELSGAVGSPHAHREPLAYALGDSDFTDAPPWGDRDNGTAASLGSNVQTDEGLSPPLRLDADGGLICRRELLERSVRAGVRALLNLHDSQAEDRRPTGPDVSDAAQTVGGGAGGDAHLILDNRFPASAPLRVLSLPPAVLRSELRWRFGSRLTAADAASLLARHLLFPSRHWANPARDAWIRGGIDWHNLVRDVREGDVQQRAPADSTSTRRGQQHSSSGDSTGPTSGGIDTVATRRTVTDIATGAVNATPALGLNAAPASRPRSRLTLAASSSNDSDFHTVGGKEPPPAAGYLSLRRRGGMPTVTASVSATPPVHASVEPLGSEEEVNGLSAVIRGGATVAPRSLLSLASSSPASSSSPPSSLSPQPHAPQAYTRVRVPPRGESSSSPPSASSRARSALSSSDITATALAANRR